MRLDTHRLQTLDQVREFLAGSAGIALQPQRRAAACALVATTAQRFDYALCGKPDKGLLRRFLSKATGLSRAQVTRLLRQHRTTGAVTDRRGAPRRPFARRYTRADIGLLAETDALHGTLSGPATRALCARGDPSADPPGAGHDWGTPPPAAVRTARLGPGRYGPSGRFGRHQGPTRGSSRCPTPPPASKPGTTFDPLDAVATARSDNETARALDLARERLFRSLDPAA